ncbi:MAG: hypothetical protein ACKKL5_03775 [Candidatus Komeilibacteria bacterium]
MGNSKIKKVSEKTSWKSFFKKPETIHAGRKALGFLVVIPGLVALLLHPVWVWFAQNSTYAYAYVLVGVGTSILGIKEEWEYDAGRRWMNRIMVAIVLLFVSSLIWPHSFAKNYVTDWRKSAATISVDNTVLSTNDLAQQFDCGFVGPGARIVFWVEKGVCDLEVVGYFRRHIDRDQIVNISRPGRLIIKVASNATIKYQIVSNA